MDDAVQGLIGYFRRGSQTGCEHFAICTAADGARNLRAHCEMWDDELLRDGRVSQRMDWGQLDANYELLDFSETRR